MDNVNNIEGVTDTGEPPVKPHYILASEADQKNGIPAKQICTCLRGVDHAPHLKDVPVEIVGEPTGSEKLAQSMIGQRNTGPIEVINVPETPRTLEFPESWTAPEPELEETPIESSISNPDLITHMGIEPTLWAEHFKIATGLDDLVEEATLVEWFSKALIAGHGVGYQEGYRLGKKQRSNNAS